ncbi:MAG: DeoR/GlpR family DNA-binding transcription regulator [Cohaesibacter sp.]|nr:DeoR/GlpR family DNA-binding transcription regulator [Cohaesibacter sp.]
MSAYSHRQMHILAKVHECGSCEIETLAQVFAVSTQTIRRDVNLLCERGELRRIRGGVTTPPNQPQPVLASRNVENAQSNELAQQVADHIANGSSLAMIASSLMLDIARALQAKSALHLFTNDLAVALMASQQKDWQVSIAGGAVRHGKQGSVCASNAVTGPNVADFFSRYEVDVTLIQASALSEQGHLLAKNEQQAHIIQTAMKHARKSLLLIEKKHFDPTAYVRCGHLDQINHVIEKAHPAMTQPTQKPLEQSWLKVQMDGMI